MRKYYFIKFIGTILIIFGLSLFVPTDFVTADTEVTGEITNKNTVWTKDKSPYKLVGTITISKSYTLTIEPGVEIYMTGGFDMFNLEGEIIANGTEGEPIIFDGYSNSRFINGISGSSFTSAKLSYCQIKNMRDLFYFRFSYLSLTNSIIENSTKHSYIFNPQKDLNIAFNNFKNCAGWTISQGDKGLVTFQNNIFNGLNSNSENIYSYLIKNTSNFNVSGVVVKYNTFKNIAGAILVLEAGSINANIEAQENYWEGISKEEIGEKIIDKDDNKDIANTIEYLPLLGTPHINTPGTVIVAVPTIDSITTPTNIALQTISGAKEAGTAIILNNEEIIPINFSNSWSYNLELMLGENLLNFKSVDASGVESKIVNTIIVFTGSEEIICTEWIYSDWSECVSGQQARTTISALPENCTGGNPILSQICTQVVSDNFIEAEKRLVVAVDHNLTESLSGKILLQVEENGEAWYVYPENKKKYYLGRPLDAFNIMKSLGLGATHEFITKYEIYPNYVIGKILIDVEDNGRAYYINPIDKKAYYLNRPSDAFRIMRELALGITNSDIRKIGVGEL